MLNSDLVTKLTIFRKKQTRHENDVDSGYTNGDINDDDDVGD